MTVMAAEAGAGAAASEAGAASRAGRRVTGGRTGGRTSQGRGPETYGDRGRFGPARPTSTPPRFGGRTQQGSRGGGTRPRGGGRTQQSTSKPVRSSNSQSSGGKSSSGTRRRGGGQVAPRGLTQSQSRTSYQAVVLAEFVAAVLLVAATPFAKKSADGVSPYVGKDLLQLVALTTVYFLLALVSGTNRGAGRFAAWFGGLILLTVGLGEAARLAKLFNIFGLTAPPDQAGQPPEESNA